MLKKIKDKINEVGVKDTLHWLDEKIIQRTCIKYNPFIRKNNLLKKEWTHYWKCYKFIEKKYKKILLKMPEKKGTNEYSNKVWWCWLQGEENAPKLQKECLKSLRRHLNDREIIVITKDNLYDYIEMPEYIKEKYEKGIISNTHFSDLIRLQLLIKYGGTWIDSSTYCTGYDKTLFDIPLFVYSNCNNIWYYHKNSFAQEPLIADSWFITSEIGNPILETVRDLLFIYWKRNNHLIDYFLLHYFFTLTVNYKYNNLFKDMPIVSHLVPHILQYECLNKYDEKNFDKIKAQSSFHKLTQKIDTNLVTKDSYYNYILMGGKEKN